MRHVHATDLCACTSERKGSLWGNLFCWISVIPQSYSIYLGVVQALDVGNAWTTMAWRCLFDSLGPFLGCHSCAMEFATARACGPQVTCRFEWMATVLVRPPGWLVLEGRMVNRHGVQCPVFLLLKWVGCWQYCTTVAPG
jgi:hypothetical protein